MELSKLPEIVQIEAFLAELDSGSCRMPESGPQVLADVGMSASECRTAITAAFATMVLHAESRASAFVGEGFYTIGPGGEEVMSAVGLRLRDDDAAALHYRHLCKPLCMFVCARTRGLDGGRGAKGCFFLAHATAASAFSPWSP